MSAEERRDDAQLAMPDAARLGPFTYRITTEPGEWELSERSDPARDYGYTDHERGVVIVHERTTGSMRRVVLLHELMHAAVFAGGGLDNRKRREEDWVRMTAPMLLDALQRSPELVEYLLDDAPVEEKVRPLPEIDQLLRVRRQCAGSRCGACRDLSSTHTYAGDCTARPPATAPTAREALLAEVLRRFGVGPVGSTGDSIEDLMAWADRLLAQGWQPGDEL